MIPTIPESAMPDISRLDIGTQPGHTYHLDLNSKRILGKVDGVDAVIQALHKILHTERYAWLIYDWNYGMELEQYIGEGMDYVMADIELSVTEALQVDDRVLSIQDFHMEKKAIDALAVEFMVTSTEGDARIELEVAI